MELLLVSCASLLAGFIDAVSGGGGLVLVPALFAVFPNAHPATLLGTNKSASICGTLVATRRYLRYVNLGTWRSLLPAVLLGFAGALLGAWVVTVMSPLVLRKMLPFVLLAVLVYTFIKKDLGRTHAPHLSPGAQAWATGGIGLTLGFYDGFFGPGMGSFLVFLFVRCLGFDFLHASAYAKLLNTATNLAALCLFVSKGHIWWHFVLPLAVCNVLGSLLGTHFALKHGSGFVRVVFLLVVSALLLKTGFDAFLR